MALCADSQPTRIPSKFSRNAPGGNPLLTGDVPSEESFAFDTIERAVKACSLDDRFDKLKPIKRNLYNKPANSPDYTKEELTELWESMSKLKVYPYNEGSAVKIPAPYRSFEDAFSNNPAILAEIKKNGFETPSAVQSQMWPTLLSGIDCVGVSQTGSGKTLAFLLPAFLHIDAQYAQYDNVDTKPCPSVLVLTPTRELAQQIEREVEKYSYNGYKSVCLYGGAGRNEQMAACRKGIEIVIATPGRLADLAAEGVIQLSSVSYVVLDEADRMLDMGFEPSIRRIMFEIRPDRLVGLTSATWPPAVRDLAQKYTKDGVMVVVGSLDLSACKSVKQYIEFLDHDQKFDRMCEIVAYLNREHGKGYKMIVFVKAKVLADHLSSDFCLKGINSQGMHGGRSQQDRENSLNDLRSGKVQIMIATDLASRGIDIVDITHVVNYDFPGDIEEYVHRVGRTGRAGRSGEAMSFMTWQDRFHAAELITILEKSEQDVPQELRRMATRHAEKIAREGERPRKPFQRKEKESNFAAY